MAHAILRGERITWATVRAEGLGRVEVRRKQASQLVGYHLSVVAVDDEHEFFSVADRESEHR
ncbi:MAG: hypothetical protein ACJAS7_000739 [Alpinimonas sp.]|jgi:hypothetical protein